MQAKSERNTLHRQLKTEFYQVQFARISKSKHTNRYCSISQLLQEEISGFAKPVFELQGKATEDIFVSKRLI